MSLLGRPEGEYRSAQHEGSPVSPPGRPKGECRSAQHDGRPLIRWAAALALLACSAVAHALPSFEAVQAAHRPSDLTLLDRHGTPLQTLRVDPTVRRLPWVPLAEMSPALLQAIVLSEDRRFWAHAGVDWSAVASSAFGNLWNTRTRGASTLTMQLAGLLDEDLARPPQGRSVAQKLGQAVAARRLEARWRKSEILEAYLNTVPLRGELVGIGAVAQTLFGKHPSGLDAFEAAITAALLRAPNAQADAVARRACGVLQDMQLDCAGVVALTANTLLRRGGMPLGEQIAPHAARQLLRRDGPAAQRSTLDAGTQRLAIRALRSQLAELRGRAVDDGAVVVLDNASGELLAWVGSAGATSDAAQVDHVLARRQPGSTLKPFLYGLAFERRLLTPASLVDDAPAQIATAAGLYLPQNYDRRFQGWVSARTALGASLNVPAVRVATLLPPDALFERLNALGLALPESGGYYGHALALGGADVTLLALANAYRALANGGLVSAPTLHPGGAAGGPAQPLGSAAIDPALPVSRPARDAARPAGGAASDALLPGLSRTPRRVMDAAGSFLVTHILADNSARAITFGLDSALATRGWAAVKTGTSKDLRDNWCIGFTDRYTVGVWVGNASGAPMHAVSGIAGAAPVWRELLQHLHRERPSRPPAAPAGVQAMRVHLAAADEPPREEWFLAGTLPDALPDAMPGAISAAMPGATPAETPNATTTAAGAARRLGIHSPADGSLFALDPDIPPQAQRISFEGAGGTWWLDGRRLGRGSTLRWAPWPGRHTLALVDADGRTLQTVRFEVRGAVVRPRAGAAAPAGTAPARPTPGAGAAMDARAGRRGRRPSVPAASGRRACRRPAATSCPSAAPPARSAPTVRRRRGD